MIHNFTCNRCNQEKSYESDFATGYATNDKGEKICYQCCGELDRQYMIDNGAISLYLTIDKKYPSRGKVTNWPGTLSLPVGIKVGRHNIAGVRYDCWFTFNGHVWHGVTYGDNTQICHCKQTKEMVG